MQRTTTCLSLLVLALLASNATAFWGFGSNDKEIKAHIPEQDATIELEKGFTIEQGSDVTRITEQVAKIVKTVTNQAAALKEIMSSRKSDDADISKAMSTLAVLSNHIHSQQADVKKLKEQDKDTKEDIADQTSEVKSQHKILTAISASVSSQSASLNANLSTHQSIAVAAMTNITAQNSTLMVLTAELSDKVESHDSWITPGKLLLAALAYNMSRQVDTHAAQIANLSDTLNDLRSNFTANITDIRENMNSTTSKTQIAAQVAAFAAQQSMISTLSAAISTQQSTIDQQSEAIDQQKSVNAALQKHLYAAQSTLAANKNLAG